MTIILQMMIILTPTLRKTHAPLLQEEVQYTATVVGEEALLEDFGGVDRSKAVTDIGLEDYPLITFDALLVETFEFSIVVIHDNVIIELLRDPT
jgi:hypothetical protein